MIDKQTNSELEELSKEEVSQDEEILEDIQMEERPQLTPLQRVLNFAVAFLLMTLILQLMKWLQTL